VQSLRDFNHPPTQLLNEGKTMFFGKVSESFDYFRKIGFPCPFFSSGYSSSLCISFWPIFSSLFFVMLSK
jgi:hypothetical protein